MFCRSTLFLLCLAASTSILAADITLKGPEKDLANAVVSIPAGKDLPEGTNAVELPGGRMVPAQWAGPMLVDGAAGPKRLVFVVRASRLTAWPPPSAKAW